MKNPFRKKSSVIPWIAATFALLGILIGLGIREFTLNNDEKIIKKDGAEWIEGPINEVIENPDTQNTQFLPLPKKTAEKIFQDIAQEMGLISDVFSTCLNKGLTAEKVKKDATDGRSHGITGTPAFFINGRLLVGALPYENFVKIFEEELTGNGPTENRISVNTDNDFALGQSNTPITMIEFSDFQCPYCAQFHMETFAKIKEKYIDTGKVRYIIRDFPLGGHQHAQKAAEAARCAAMQGATMSTSGAMEGIYFEYVKKLFEKNVELSNAL